MRKHATRPAVEARKMHAALVREGFTVARRTVERLMRQAGPRGNVGQRPAHHTPRSCDRPALGPGRAVVHRHSPEPILGRRHPRIRTFSGWAHAAFVIDAFLPHGRRPEGRHWPLRWPHPRPRRWRPGAAITPALASAALCSPPVPDLSRTADSVARYRQAPESVVPGTPLVLDPLSEMQRDRGPPSSEAGLAALTCCTDVSGPDAAESEE
ncbi:IS3 family transposase [Streptomyces sp. NPDC056255]|uniref:IS3 family transposase n=1 Tax=Streptomyces sp. NPDC056255 TaxID=3345764 RepID=UPI0035D6FC43